MGLIAHLSGLRMARRVRRCNYYAPFFQASLTILKNYNIVYVENSKVGCTKIKKLLLEIDNWPNKWNEVIAREVHVHNKALTGMIGAENLTYSALSKVACDAEYFRFGFVRNPYDRLLSAYKDKIHSPHKYPDKKNYIPIAQKIKASVTGGDYRKINLDEMPVSFEEFVAFVSRQKSYDMDRHWFHQHLTMWHPFMKLCFVGKFESFSDDLYRVLKHIGAPDCMLNDVGSRENSSFISGEKYYNSELAQIVYKKFKRDFDIYNYDPQSWRQW